MANVHHQNIEIKSVSERMWYIRLGVLSLRNRTTHRSLNRDKFCVCTPNKKNDITFDSYASNLDYYSFSCKQAGKKKKSKCIDPPLCHFFVLILLKLKQSRSRTERNSVDVVSFIRLNRILAVVSFFLESSSSSIELFKIRLSASAITSHGSI